eukprot:3184835-Prymnesium_polylepis.1
MSGVSTQGRRRCPDCATSCVQYGRSLRAPRRSIEFLHTSGEAARSGASNHFVPDAASHIAVRQVGEHCPPLPATRGPRGRPPRGGRTALFGCVHGLRGRLGVWRGLFSANT